IPEHADAEERQRIERHNTDAALAALRALADRQLLCALREDAFGALAANRAIERRLAQHWNIDADRPWYPGRAVLIPRNDFAPGMLPAHDGAFAITIHKSQGSEYAHAAVLLPPDPDHRILSRQLLYTGLSRAKSDVELWATDAALEAALAHPVHRAGGLAARL